MTADAYAFVSGPRMVSDITGVSVATDELGGAGVHAVAHRARLARRRATPTPRSKPVGDLLELPAVARRRARRRTGRPTIRADRATPELRDLVPAASQGSYDVRDAIRSIADDGDVIELRAGWARQPRHRARGDRRPSGRLRRQPAAVDRGHARHRGVAEGRPVRRVLRRVQPADRHADRHARLLSRARTSSGAA